MINNILSYIAESKMLTNISIITFSIGVTLLLFLIIDYFKCPFRYPLIIYDIDISGKRKPSYDDYIDEWIIAHPGMIISELFNERLQSWEEKCESRIAHAWFWKKHKKAIYESMYEDVTDRNYLMYKFVFFRKQTRYKQVNYQRHPYTVRNVDYAYKFSLLDLFSL